MKLIVGLGNSEEKYFGTRHNAGRLGVEFLARNEKLSFSRKKLEASWCALWQSDSGPVTLSYPDHFMNLSGESVSKLVKHLDLNPASDLLILVDDVALPFGRLRLRAKGSDGGHNGLKSIDQYLGTSDYARLRIGVGIPQAEDSAAVSIDQIGVPLETYVLQPFTKKEQENLPEVLRRVEQACRDWLLKPIEQAMNAVNPV